MRHDWVLDVLHDLIAYAQRNDLPGLAQGAAVLCNAAEAEIAAQADVRADPAPDDLDRGATLRGSRAN